MAGSGQQFSNIETILGEALLKLVRAKHDIELGIENPEVAKIDTLQMVEKYLKLGASPNLVFTSGNVGTLELALGCHPSEQHALIKLLLEYGASPNCQNTTNGMTFLQLTILKEDWDSVFTFLDLYSKIPYSPQHLEIALYITLLQNTPDSKKIAKKLLNAGVNPNRFGPALNLVLNGLNNANGTLPLYLARGDEEMMFLLLIHGASPKITVGNSPPLIMQLIEDNDFKNIVIFANAFKKACIDREIEHSEYIKLALGYALSELLKSDASEKVEKAKILLNAGAYPNISYSDKNCNILILALGLSNIEERKSLIKLFLFYRVNPNTININTQETALDTAIINNDWDSVHTLLTSQSIIHHSFRTLANALMHTMFSDALGIDDQKKITKILLEAGADPNVRYAVERSAGYFYILHSAVFSASDEELLYLLLVHGSNPSLKNSDERTPLERLVANNEFTKIITYSNALKKSQDVFQKRNTLYSQPWLHLEKLTLLEEKERTWIVSETPTDYELHNLLVLFSKIPQDIQRNILLILFGQEITPELDIYNPSYIKMCVNKLRLRKENEEMIRQELLQQELREKKDEHTPSIVLEPETTTTQDESKPVSTATTNSNNIDAPSESKRPNTTQSSLFSSSVYLKIALGMSATLGGCLMIVLIHSPLGIITGITLCAGGMTLFASSYNDKKKEIVALPHLARSISL